MSSADLRRAVEEHRSRLAPALACLMRAPLRWGGGHTANQPFVVLLGDGEPVSLAGCPLSFGLVEQLRVADGRAKPLAYSYIIEVGGHELLAFHWHPTGASSMKTPHLHVQADVEVGGRWLGKAHLPTGKVSAIDVLWLLLEELSVPPLRDDWRPVLEASRPD